MQDNFVILLVCFSQHTFVDLMFVPSTLRFPKYYGDNHLPRLIFLEITDASELNSCCVWRKQQRAVKTGKPAARLRRLSWFCHWLATTVRIHYRGHTMLVCWYRTT